MKQQEAIIVAEQVTKAIQHIDTLYVSIVLKNGGNREVVIRMKGDTQK